MGTEPSAGARGEVRPDREERWAAHRGLSILVSVAVFLLPVLVAIAAALVFVRLVPKPGSDGGMVIWWVLAVAGPWLVYLGANRLARRALPLAALLKMTLVFPDRAPSRLAVVRRAGSTRGLERQLQQSEEGETRDELSVAAERILALATSLSKHDRLTRGHSERVRALTDLIADQMKLPTADRDRLRWASLLHDIGKLTVPVSVLNKGGKPDADEWQVLRGHPLEGKRLVAPLADWLGEWAACVPEHHEKFDGTGYPLGLAGEEISLGGRIVAVADTYDAMTSTRSYSRSVTPAMARQELTACAGTQFDPVVVRAFLEASVGRLTAVGGPLAWLGELTSANGVSQVGQVVGALGHALAGVAALVGVGLAVVLGAHHAPEQHLADRAPAAAIPGKPADRPTSAAGGAHPVPQVADRRVTSTQDPPAAPRATPAGDPAGGGGFNDPPSAPPGAPPEPPNPTTGTTTTSTPTTTTTTSAPPVSDPATVPGAPVGVVATAGDAAATVSWSAPASDGGSPVTGYAVVATDRTTPADGGQECAWTAGPLTCTVTGLVDGDTYTFTAWATNTVGTGPASPASGPVTPVTVPGPPVGVVATAGDASATVSWSAPASDGGSPVTGYEITTYVGLTATATTTVGAVTTDVVGGLIDGDTYSFTVTALSAVGIGATSGLSDAVTPSTVPGAPGGVVATAGDAAATVSWSAPGSDGGSPVTGYAVVATDLTTPADGGQVCTWTTGPLTCTVTGLVDGDTYTFTAWATNPVGTGPASAPSGPVTPVTVPGPPVGVVATAGDTVATVSWSAPAFDGGSPITGYTVVATDLTTPADGGQVCTWTTGSLTCSVTGLVDGDTYTFTVSAVSAVGQGSPSGPSNPVTPATVPGPPTIVSVVPGLASVTVTWTPPASDGGSPITQYTVVAGDATVPTNGGQSCIWTSGPFSCTVTGLAVTDSYVFGASATNAVGTSATSALSGFVIPVSMVMSGQTGMGELVGPALFGNPAARGQAPADHGLPVVGVAHRVVRRARHPAARGPDRRRLRAETSSGCFQLRPTSAARTPALVVIC